MGTRKLLALVAVAAVSFTGCSLLSGQKGGIDVTAKFSDVGDLASGAPVMMADITVGAVKTIELAGDQALVTMSVEPSAHIPEGVIARIRRTSLLGERIVDLVVPPSVSSSAPLLKDGGRITKTESRPDLEDLVRSGTDVLAPIAASEVATMVNEGAKGFGGQGQNLKALLLNFRDIVHAYAGRTQQIESVISSLNQFNGTLARHASAQARSIANSAKALGVLRAESDHLVSAVKSLVRLAKGARAILDQHSDEMSHFFSQMRVILGVLRSEQSSIAGALKWAPYHNRNTQLVEFMQFNQVLQDFIFCGMNDDPKDPARKCYGSGSSGSGSGAKP
jgi:phospholipid/cholesterol/gamma-HCH transport system substrate-binding protein